VFFIISFPMAAKHSIRTVLAILSALAIWIAALLQVLQAFGVTKDESVETPTFNATIIANFRQLDPPTLIKYWAYRRSQASIDISSDLLFSLGLLCLAYCVLCLKRIFKKWTKDSDLPNFMVGCFFFGALIPSLEFLQAVGSATTSNWIAAWPGFPPIGFQILYVSSVLDQGRGIYLLSLQFLFISIGLSITTHLSWKTGDLPKKHAVLGGITAAVGFLTFLMEFLTFQAAGTGQAFGIGILLWGIIFLPIWTIWLGVELRRLKEEERRDGNVGNDTKFVGFSDESSNTNN